MIMAVAADMTTTLTITAHRLPNKTNITCLTPTEENVITKSSSIFYFADIPRWNNNNFSSYQEKGTYFTALLELGTMFDGGGVPIDHYIIQVDNGTQLETTGPTYSFDIMYNTTLSVNISAHNCAGYSDLFPLEIQYDQATDNNEATPDGSNGGSNGGLCCSLLELAGLIGIGVFLLIVTTLVTALSLYLIRKHRSKKKSHHFYKYQNGEKWD
ncbi:hypothetical protein GBAR_LOCUS15431 [Geodia barretti]|uniref:Uncharacterized protein n=1 Tax=Geodia barretti TaxID=519541 RepID=A0AA35SC27_GEOBA|nr:hypothetical protein GBAR_LOCUS15431 [Geodia barretti]